MNDEYTLIRKTKLQNLISSIEKRMTELLENPELATESEMKDLDDKIKQSKEEVEDILIEIEVEDFLANGAGRTSDVEYA